MRGIDPGEWERRLKFRYPMLRYFTSRPFGVEIETFGLKYSVTAGDRDVIPPYKITSRAADGALLPQVFQQQGLTLNGFSPDEPRYEAWSFVLDDSIKGAGGSELVSPILSGLKGLAQVYDALLVLQEFPEIQVNETCGFHVHHGVDPEKFGDTQLFQLLRIISIFEGYIYCLLPEERRQAEACRPLEIDLYKWYRNNGGGSAPEVQSLWYSPENLNDPQVPRNRKIHPTRYHGLNLHSYWYRNTIEFRYFPSMIDDPEELMQWIIFTQFLVEWSEGRRPQLEYLPKPNKWLNTLYKIYLGAGMMSHIHFPGTLSPGPGEISS
ncbi:MAG: amidoligase family protein [Desulfobaccales bacterium]